MNLKTLFVFAALASAGVAVSAHATELVANPGFETGNYNGWTVSGGNYLSTSEAHSGTYGSVSYGDNFLSQTLPTVIGQKYTVSFFLAWGGASQLFSASFAGFTGTSLDASPLSSAYMPYTFNVVATTTSSLLYFDFGFTGTSWDLDDVSVTPSAPVPDAANTLALLSVATIGALGLREWHTRRAA